MSRRRGEGGGVSSLEMLLDTMCNTFGSLIFMAVLLAIINQRVSRTVESRARQGISPAEAERQTARITELKATAQGLQQTLQQLVELESRAAEIKPQDLTATRRARQERLTALELRRKQLEEHLAAAQEEAEKLHRQLAETKGKIEQAKANPGAAVLRTFSVPSLHEVNRELNLTCALKAGKFYGIHDPQRSWNYAQVEVADSAGVFTVRLKDDTGIPVRPEGLASALGQVLALEPQRTLVVLHVAPDSFREFQLVKRVVVERGFEYNWIPWEGALTFKSGKDREAQ